MQSLEHAGIHVCERLPLSLSSERWVTAAILHLTRFVVISLLRVAEWTTSSNTRVFK